MFKLEVIIPINFNIEPYGKYTKSSIIRNLIDFKHILLLDSLLLLF